MASTEEPFDASEEQYILKEVSKIRAVTQLDELVRGGALKSEKAIYAKEKYHELRNVYLSMLTTERTLKAEVDEMEVQLKVLSNELEKVLRDSAEDEETLELVREDAEQAESEAQICKEKEQTILMEVSDLLRLQELYKERIEEIEKEHATALAPLVSRYKLEIQAAKDVITDSLVKKEQCLKEIEECKQRIEQSLDDLQNIHLEKKADLANLEGIEGVPEKYRKQADILSTAVKALQMQDQKWSDKMKEVEAELAGLQASAKHLTEEIANTTVQIEKTQLLTQQKERQEADIAKELEVATLEVDDYLADQVNVDMQLRSKAADLRLEQDQLATRMKEKEKALRRLKIEEQLVLNIQASIPLLIVERDKVHSQVVVVENERKKVTAMVDELRKEIDLQMHNFLVVEALGKEVAASLHATHSQVATMEGEVADCANIERLKYQHINHLTMMRERMCRQAAQKHHMWKEALKKLHVMEIMVRNTSKRDLEMEQQIKDAVLLYNLVRSQRNKFASLVQASGVSIAEMKDKLVTTTTEVEALQKDVKYKDKVLAKQRAEYQAGVRARTQLLSDLTKRALLLRQAQTQADEYELDVAKLEGFVTASEREMVKTRKLYGIEVTHRNQTGIALIDRMMSFVFCTRNPMFRKFKHIQELNEYSQTKNQKVEVLKHSEVEQHKRTDEIRYLKIQEKHLKQQIFVAYKTAPDFSKIYDTLKDLKKQLDKARVTTARLSELVENPDNISRWQLLPGRDLTELELHLKMTAIDEFLSAKADQALEKEFILEEVTALVDDLRKQAAENHESSREHSEKVTHYQRYVQSLTSRMMATVSELSLCQATVMSLKEEKDRLQAELLQAYELLAAGESPTEAATRAWLAKERETVLLLKWEQDRENKRIEQEQLLERRKAGITLKSTAEQRPNAYIEEELGLPKPFGLYSPFKPSDAGAQMRHFKAPEPKPVQL